MHSIRAVTAVLAVAAVLPAPAAARADAPTELVSARAVEPVVDTAAGWAYPELEVHLRDPDGLPDSIGQNAATATGGTAMFPGELTWATLNRVSGTATDGIWRGTVRVGPAWAGTYTVDQIVPVGAISNGPTFTVRGDRWVVTAVRQTLKVVSGTEIWHPTARVADAGGRPVGGARIDVGGFTAYLPAGSPPGTPAAADGVWTSPRPVPVAQSTQFLTAWGGRGSRGFSLQGVTCNDLTVKLQASATYPAGPVARGATVVVTGHVWPAPAILRGQGGRVQLQERTAAGWHTVAAVDPRLTGRYTLNWTAAPTGTHVVRVRWPGAGVAAECRTYSLGTTLAAATVTVR
jgi:hypothetical protein